MQFQQTSRKINDYFQKGHLLIRKKKKPVCNTSCVASLPTKVKDEQKGKKYEKCRMFYMLEGQSPRKKTKKHRIQQSSLALHEGEV